MKTFLVEVCGPSGKVVSAAEYSDRSTAVRVADWTFKSTAGTCPRVAVTDASGETIFAKFVSGFEKRKEAWQR